ncbi:MAG TPA: HPF/RaiA family ribosome-associated protein [Candidatus Binatia bacterium]|nr:HPF/RaiA family ribosome-associated protein [Candidatus Binatia bacterium]
MNIQLRTQGTDMSEAFRAHAERCLGFALRRFGNRIDRVSVSLADVNGPRGGIDKCCRIAVRLRPTGSAFVAETSSDSYAALGRAAGRVGSAVAGRIARERERRRDFYERGTDAGRLPLS